MTKVSNQTSEAVGTADDVDTTTDDESEEDTSALEESFEDETWDDADDEDDDSDTDDDEAEATDEDDDDAEDSDEDVESEDSKDDEEAEADSTPAKDAEKPTDTELAERQRKNQEAAAYRVRVKLEREEAKAKVQSDYIAAGKNDTQRALRQLEVDGYNNQIRATTTELRERVLSARQSIDLFSSKEPRVQNAMLDALDDFEARFVEKDTNGDFVDIRVDPETGEKADVRQFLAKRADAIRGLTGLGAKQQEQAKKSQKKRTATLPSRTPVKKKGDPMLEAFDEEAAR